MSTYHELKELLPDTHSQLPAPLSHRRDLTETISDKWFAVGSLVCAAIDLAYDAVAQHLEKGKEEGESLAFYEARKSLQKEYIRPGSDIRVCLGQAVHADLPEEDEEKAAGILSLVSDQVHAAVLTDARQMGKEKFGEFVCLMNQEMAWSSYVLSLNNRSIFPEDYPSIATWLKENNIQLSTGYSIGFSESLEVVALLVQMVI